MRATVASRKGPSKGPPALAEAQPNKSHRDLRCAVIIAILLSIPLATTQAIARQAGAGGNDYIKRLIDHLQAYGSLDDGPRKVKPRLYTEEVFEAALEVLGCHRENITQAKLVKELQRIGILSRGHHDAKYFFSLLKAHCKEHGLEARAGVTKGESFLTEDDFGKRLGYITRLRKLMKEKGYAWSDLVFMDETSVNASNHPKCKYRVLQAGTADHMRRTGVFHQPLQLDMHMVMLLT